MGAQAEYIIFLSNQLEQRRVEQQVELNIELGRREFNRLNYSEAIDYFRKAEKIIGSTVEQNTLLKDKLFNYLNAALAAEIPSNQPK